jgi:hypothetical protein
VVPSSRRCRRSGMGAGISLAKIAKIAKAGKAEFDVRTVLFRKLNLWFFLAILARAFFSTLRES